VLLKPAPDLKRRTWCLRSSQISSTGEMRKGVERSLTREVQASILGAGGGGGGGFGGGGGVLVREGGRNCGVGTKGSLIKFIKATQLTCLTRELEKR